ncbi:MAG TPA: hypothetical protein PLC99_14330 [Verrucomicrobiota bacterium]|nr:hypothetical protein [Verrucomicrobiota bacterium]
MNCAGFIGENVLLIDEKLCHDGVECDREATFFGHPGGGQNRRILPLGECGYNAIGDLEFDLVCQTAGESWYGILEEGIDPKKWWISERPAIEYQVQRIDGQRVVLEILEGM